MKHLQQYDMSRRLALFADAATDKGLFIVEAEKDWWVCMVLKALTLTQYFPLMSFKGGTTLSKVWKLTDRFSEDIDISLRREGRFAISGTTNTQLAKVRRKARHYVIRELPVELEEALHSLGVNGFSIESETEKKKKGVMAELRADAHPSVIYVNYDSIVENDLGRLLPRVKIEVSCLSMDEPVEEMTIRSYVSEVAPDAEDVEVRFKTVLPTRTFLEKIFLLHEEFKKEKPRCNRMSRHLYDLERLMDTPFGINALNDRELYDEIVKHRSVFNRIPYVDYTTHSPATIDFIPPERVMDKWREDYNSLTEHLLFSTRRKLSYDEAIARMQELRERLRRMG